MYQTTCHRLLKNLLFLPEARFLVFMGLGGAAKYTLLYRQVLVCASEVSTRSWSKFLCLVVYDVSRLSPSVVAHSVRRLCMVVSIFYELIMLRGRDVGYACSWEY